MVGALDGFILVYGIGFTGLPWFTTWLPWIFWWQLRWFMPSWPFLPSWVRWPTPPTSWEHSRGLVVMPWGDAPSETAILIGKICGRMMIDHDRPLVSRMVLGFLILRQPALKVWRCGTSICSIARDIGSCTTLQDIGSCNRVNRVSRWLIARKTLALWEFGLSKDGLFLAQGVHILRCNVGRSQGDARFLHPKRG